MISFVRGQKNDLYGGMAMKLPVECMHSRIFSYLATDSSDEYARSVVERRARTCVKKNSKHKTNFVSEKPKLHNDYITTN